MSSEVASLELKISSDGVEKAEGRLKRMAGASVEADRATGALSKTVETINRATDSYTGVGRRCASMLSELDAQAKRTASGLDRINAAVERMRTADINRLRPPSVSTMTLPGQSGILPDLLRGSVGGRATESLKMFRDAQAASTKAEADFVKGLREADAAAAQKVGTIGRLTAGLSGMVVPLLAAGGAYGAVQKTLRETIEFEDLSARLEGVAGGAAEARAEFDRLEKISDGMRQTEGELVESFLKLEHTGLDPSERSLKSFANIAAATGKSLDSLTELTLSASMGVFRGLKDLGIKAVAEGDKVKMTYRGVTTSVENSAQAIQEYLVKIGETQFAGAAARQLDTMGGAVKQLEDAWGDLFREVGRNAVGEFIATSMRVAADAINATTTAVEALFYTMSKKPAGMSAERMGALNDWIRGATGWGTEGDDGYGKIRDTLAELEKLSKTGHQANLEKYNEIRASLMEASTTQDFDARAALADLDAWYARVSGAGAKGATKDYEPKIAPGFDVDFAQRAKDAQDELDRLMAKDEEMRRESKRYDEERRQAAEERKRLSEQVTEGLLSEEEQLRASYDRRLEDLDRALAAEAITDERYDELKLQRLDELNRKRRDLDASYAQASAQNAALIFGNLSTVVKNAGGETSAAYKHLFAMQKAFAVASGTINMFRSISEASAQPFPANVPLMLKAASEGAALLAQISGTNYAGAYDRGGDIPAGKWGIAGEYGPEIVRGPATVTSRADTARALGSQPVNIRIVNAPDQAAAERFLASPQGEKVLVNFVRRNATTIRTMLG